MKFEFIDPVLNNLKKQKEELQIAIEYIDVQISSLEEYKAKVNEDFKLKGVSK